VHLHILLDLVPITSITSPSSLWVLDIKYNSTVLDCIASLLVIIDY